MFSVLEPYIFEFNLALKWPNFRVNLYFGCLLLLRADVLHRDRPFCSFEVVNEPIIAPDRVGHPWDGHALKKDGWKDHRADEASFHDYGEAGYSEEEWLDDLATHLDIVVAAAVDNADLVPSVDKMQLFGDKGLLLVEAFY